MSSNSPDDRVYELLQEVEDLPEGLVKYRLVQEASRLADSTRDIDRMFAARLQLIETGAFSGHAESSLTAPCLVPVAL